MEFVVINCILGETVYLNDNMVKNVDKIIEMKHN
jgi:hypothetical protein